MSPPSGNHDGSPIAAPTLTRMPVMAYIALACRDAVGTARFLGDHLGLSRFSVSTPTGDAVMAFRAGETALVAFPQGHAFLSQDGAGVDHVAIAAADPLAASRATGLTLEPAMAMAGLDGQAQAALAREATCGVHVRYTPVLDLPTVNREVVERIDHLGIASSDNAKAEDIFCRHVGAVYESRQTDMEVATAIESFTSDKYGAVYHSRQPEIVGGLRVSFLSVGDLELEFLQNFDPAQGFEIRHGSAGNTKQDQSAIGRFVTNRGGGLHHVAFKVANIDATLGELAESDHQMIDTVGRPGSRRARIGFLHPSSTGGVLFHFVERDEIAG